LAPPYTRPREPDPESIPEAELGVPHWAGPAHPLAATSHVIIYQRGGRKEPGVKYNMAHLKVLPLDWLLATAESQELADPAPFQDTPE
jgi:hypothetical protein